MTEEIAIGVLGCADIARRRMLPAFAACPDLRVAAVAGRDPARAEETAAPYGARAVAGYEALLADARIDAVYVPLPLALHERWVRAALDAGKHVLAEKPLTSRARGTVELFRLAERRGLALVENVMFVHHSQHAEVRRLVGDGAIGELRGFRAEFTVPRRRPDDIRYSPELGGGALWDTGVYPLRAALHLLGPELEVVGAAGAAAPGIPVDSSGAVLLRTEAGVSAQLSHGLDHAYRSSYELVGSTGRLTLDAAFTPAADHRPVIRLHGAKGLREFTLPADDQVARTVAAFTAAVRTGRAPAQAVDASVRQAQLLDTVAGLTAA
ncbi:Gfo/Idh/MocA family oxidoreductase [Streptomyces sp. LHD-70]|uniref:Gfo/Idh/MocA family protein n=1 Tax=Streptomyces sp. LHD-70 TaxID=3072140 RepID=UPI00280F3A93|nr:Gfo/Idh/MocA family oxidoreductase [Streptomyces sp. LHD-70]MDQ8706189.1 Gfo/Idh/MocA family oxidoreductase [Streptomyces sp. LHD-70]